MSSDRGESDVTALVLSLGEAYTERAVASVRRQAPAVRDVVLVRGVQPFHQALNRGARQVRTPFFVQVDADMILDATCVAELRACMVPAVGIVVGQLRDPLRQRVVGIKLFRTRCFDGVQFEDSISPDTDFRQAIGARGWTTVYALKYTDAPPAAWHVFGEHRPDYTPLYTFSKYLLEGARLRYRKAGDVARGLCRRLHASSHPMACFALIGVAHGIFLETESDLLRPYARTADFEFLERFMGVPSAGRAAPAGWHEVMREDAVLGAGEWEIGRGPAVFARGYQLGVDVRQQAAPEVFRAWINRLAPQRDVAAWVTLVGLCHGIFSEVYRESEVEHAYTLLRDLLPE